MKTMCMFTRRVAAILAMLFVLQSLALANDVRIPATVNGPAASLQVAGKSVFFLSSLRDEEGNALRPADNGKWKDKNFYLPEDAQENEAAYQAFLAAIPRNVAKKTSAAVKTPLKQTPCPKPTECPKCESKVVEKLIPHGIVVIPSAHNLKVKESFKLEAFKLPNGSLADDLRYKESVAGVAKLAASKGVVTVVGLKAGNVTFQVYSQSDPNIMRELSVRVEPATADQPGQWDGVLKGFMILGAIVLLVILFLVFVSRRKNDQTPILPKPTGSGPTVRTSTSPGGRPLEPTPPSTEDPEDFRNQI